MADEATHARVLLILENTVKNCGGVPAAPFELEIAATEIEAALRCRNCLDGSTD